MRGTRPAEDTERVIEWENLPWYWVMLPMVIFRVFEASPNARPKTRKRIVCEPFTIAMWARWYPQSEACVCVCVCVCVQLPVLRCASRRC
jgi:hypothetical protein